jgi:hypothetical protein
LGRFIDIGYSSSYGEDPDKLATEAMKKQLQFAYRIDTLVATPLSVLPESVTQDEPRSFVQQNLLLGFELGLPTGQNVTKGHGCQTALPYRELVTIQKKLNFDGHMCNSGWPKD